MNVFSYLDLFSSEFTLRKKKYSLFRVIHKFFFDAKCDLCRLIGDKVGLEI